MSRSAGLFSLLTVLFMAAACGESNQNFQTALADKNEAPALERNIDYGSFSIQALADGSVLRREKSGALSDASAYLEIRLLNGSEFVRPGVKADFSKIRSGAGIRLLHHFGPVRSDFVKDMPAYGLRIINYIPNSAYVVYAEAADIRAFCDDHTESVDYLRDWSHKDRLNFQLEGRSGVQNVSVFIVNGVGKSTEVLSGLTQKVHQRPSNMGPYTVHRVSLSASDISRLQGMGDVYWIEPYHLAELADERQGMIMAGAHNGVSPTGPGYADFVADLGLENLSEVVIDITDTGCDGGTPETVTHPDLAGRIVKIRDWTGVGDGHDRGGHGTINASIIGGVPESSGDGMLDDLGYLYGLGTAPGATMVCNKIMTDEGMWGMTATYTDLIKGLTEDGVDITSNSWGMPIDGALYDAGAQEYDALVRDTDRDPSNGLQPMVIIFAAGNEGDGGFGGESARSPRSPGTAKNLITVGATENYRMTGVTDGCSIADNGADNLNHIIGFSSRGPTFDGRFKPDVMAPGTHIQGAASQVAGFTGSSVCNGYMPEGQTLYGWSSGTSHSTPGTSGAAGLLFAWYRQTYEVDPSPAMMKAMLTTHSTDMIGGDNGFGKTLEGVPSNRQGWGRIDMHDMFDDTPRMVYDQQQLFSESGQVFELINLRPSDPTKPVKISLTWTDPPGPTSGAALVNDLDLALLVNGSTPYRGNWMLDGVSDPWENFDPINNIENAILPTEGVNFFSLQVIAANITSDGVPGNESVTDQDFALYLYNVEEAQPCESNEDCSDEIDCTTDVCEENGMCSFTADNAACDDGNSCTADSCNAASGCSYENLTAVECDEGDFCKVFGNCIDGVCVSEPNLCDDEISCTEDVCDSTEQKCSSTPRASLCDDESDMTTDVCDPEQGGCVYSTGGVCDDPYVQVVPFFAEGMLASTVDHRSKYCEGSSEYKGPDIVYAADLKKGDIIEARLAPTGFDAALVVLSDCDNADSCVADGNSAMSGILEKLNFEVEKDGRYFFVVESVAAELSGEGSFYLDVRYAEETIDGGGSEADGDEESDGDADIITPDGDNGSGDGSNGGCNGSGAPLPALLMLLLALLALRRKAF